MAGTADRAHMHVRGARTALAAARPGPSSFDHPGASLRTLTCNLNDTKTSGNRQR